MLNHLNGLQSLFTKIIRRIYIRIVFYSESSDIKLQLKTGIVYRRVVQNWPI